MTILTPSIPGSRQIPVHIEFIRPCGTVSCLICAPAALDIPPSYPPAWFHATWPPTWSPSQVRVPACCFLPPASLLLPSHMSTPMGHASPTREGPLRTSAHLCSRTHPSFPPLPPGTCCYPYEPASYMDQAPPCHEASSLLTLPAHPIFFALSAVTSRVGMPAYYLHDCHYFFRTALRGLNISTSVSPLYC